MSKRQRFKRKRYFALLRGCQGKVRHASRHAARRHADGLRDDTLNAYYCTLCGGYHVGHRGKPSSAEPRQGSAMERAR